MKQINIESDDISYLCAELEELRGDLTFSWRKSNIAEALHHLDRIIEKTDELINALQGDKID